MTAEQRHILLEVLGLERKLAMLKGMSHKDPELSARRAAWHEEFHRIVNRRDLDELSTIERLNSLCEVYTAQCRVFDSQIAQAQELAE